MTHESNPTVEPRVERKSSYVSPEVIDYGDAAALTKTTSSGHGTDGGSNPPYNS